MYHYFPIFVILKRLGREGVPSICFLQGWLKPQFFVTFDIILSYIVPKNSVEIPQIVQKI